MALSSTNDIAIEFPGVGVFTRDWLEAHPERAQEILAQCKGAYPRCRCREPGLALYIARRGKYYLARLPNTGPDHAACCPSYEPDRSQSGLGIYSERALSDGGEGRVVVKLGVPLMIRGGRAGASAAMGPSAPCEGVLRDTVELPGLLHLLWERAGFNRWSPRMRNRRHYRQIYKYVLEAAEGIQLSRQLLSQHLYIPEPFVAAQALEIEARRQKQFRQMSQTAGGTPCRILLLGRLRSLDCGSPDGQIRLAHLPNEFAIEVDARTLLRLHQMTEFAWVNFPALHPEFQLWTLLTLRRVHPGHWRADALTGMVTTEEFIPVRSMKEALVAQRLVQEERPFYKPLAYDAAASRFANFLLTHSADMPIPLEIATHGASASAEAALQLERLASYEREQRRYWLWNIVESPHAPPWSERAESLERAPVTEASIEPLPALPV